MRKITLLLVAIAFLSIGLFVGKAAAAEVVTYTFNFSQITYSQSSTKFIFGFGFSGGQTVTIGQDITGFDNFFVIDGVGNSSNVGGDNNAASSKILPDNVTVYMAYDPDASTVAYTVLAVFPEANTTATFEGTLSAPDSIVTFINDANALGKDGSWENQLYVIINGTTSESVGYGEYLPITFQYDPELPPVSGPALPFEPSNGTTYTVSNISLSNPFGDACTVQGNPTIIETRENYHYAGISTAINIQNINQSSAVLIYQDTMCGDNAAVIMYSNQDVGGQAPGYVIAYVINQTTTSSYILPFGAPGAINIFESSGAVIKIFLAVTNTSMTANDQVIVSINIAKYAVNPYFIIHADFSSYFPSVPDVMPNITMLYSTEYPGVVLTVGYKVSTFETIFRWVQATKTTENGTLVIGSVRSWAAVAGPKGLYLVRDGQTILSWTNNNESHLVILNLGAYASDGWVFDNFHIVWTPSNAFGDFVTIASNYRDELTGIDMYYLQIVPTVKENPTEPNTSTMTQVGANTGPQPALVSSRWEYLFDTYIFPGAWVSSSYVTAVMYYLPGHGEYNYVNWGIQYSIFGRDPQLFTMNMSISFIAAQKFVIIQVYNGGYVSISFTQITTTNSTPVWAVHLFAASTTITANITSIDYKQYITGGNISAQLIINDSFGLTYAGRASYNKNYPQLMVIASPGGSGDYNQSFAYSTTSTVTSIWYNGELYTYVQPLLVETQIDGGVGNTLAIITYSAMNVIAPQDFTLKVTIITSTVITTTYTIANTDLSLIITSLYATPTTVITTTFTSTFYTPVLTAHLTTITHTMTTWVWTYINGTNTSIYTTVTWTEEQQYFVDDGGTTHVMTSGVFVATLSVYTQTFYQYEINPLNTTETITTKYKVSVITITNGIHPLSESESVTTSTTTVTAATETTNMIITSYFIGHGAYIVILKSPTTTTISKGEITTISGMTTTIWKVQTETGFTTLTVTSVASISNAMIVEETITISSKFSHFAFATYDEHQGVVYNKYIVADSDVYYGDSFVAITLHFTISPTLYDVFGTSITISNLTRYIFYYNDILSPWAEIVNAGYGYSISHVLGSNRYIAFTLTVMQPTVPTVRGADMQTTVYGTNGIATIYGLDGKTTLMPWKFSTPHYIESGPATSEGGAGNMCTIMCPACQVNFATLGGITGINNTNAGITFGFVNGSTTVSGITPAGATTINGTIFNIMIMPKTTMTITENGHVITTVGCPPCPACGSNGGWWSGSNRFGPGNPWDTNGLYTTGSNGEVGGITMGDYTKYLFTGMPDVQRLGKDLFNVDLDSFTSDLVGMYITFILISLAYLTIVFAAIRSGASGIQLLTSLLLFVYAFKVYGTMPYLLSFVVTVVVIVLARDILRAFIVDIQYRQ